MNNTIIAIVVTLIVAGGGGYVAGKSTADTSTSAKERQDSITMMKNQSASIRQIGEMMKSSGAALQELSVKYKDEMMMSRGKDLEAFGEKYMRDDSEAARSNDK